MKKARTFVPQSLAVLSGVLLALSFPPFNLSFLAWFAWLPLWAAIEQSHWKQGFRLGYITGLIYTLGTLNWIANNSGTSIWVATSSMVGSVLYLSLYFGTTRIIPPAILKSSMLVWNICLVGDSWDFPGCH